METLTALQGKGSVAELAERAGFPPAALDSYPHELSGGMAQRAVLALALAGRPEVVIADEPTTGLDRPLVDRVADDGIAVLMITHDLAAARRVATDLAVMYASRLVEVGPAEEVLADPWHTPPTSPTTSRGDLLDALPDKGFRPIPGHPPDLTALPDGCAYAARSSAHREVCDGSLSLRTVGARSVACGAVAGTC